MIAFLLLVVLPTYIIVDTANMLVKQNNAKAKGGK